MLPGLSDRGHVQFLTRSSLSGSILWIETKGSERAMESYPSWVVSLGSFTPR